MVRVCVCACVLCVYLLSHSFITLLCTHTRNLVLSPFPFPSPFPFQLPLISFRFSAASFHSTSLTNCYSSPPPPLPTIARIFCALFQRHPPTVPPNLASVFVSCPRERERVGRFIVAIASSHFILYNSRNKIICADFPNYTLSAIFHLPSS